MDPLALRLLEYLPLPNVAPNNQFTNANNYLTLVGFPIDQGQFSLRAGSQLQRQGQGLWPLHSNEEHAHEPRLEQRPGRHGRPR